MPLNLIGCEPLFLDSIPLEAVPREIQILPRGLPPDYLVKSAKGSFIVDDEAVRLILANFAEQTNDLVIDYEHQTYSGGEAPAAGWIKSLQDRGEAGIWGIIEWTERALGYLQRKEYRYLSPVVYVRKSDNRAVYIESAALTNLPAIDGMVPIVNKTRAAAEEKPPRRTEAKSIMSNLLEKLRKRLQLSTAATEAEIEGALDKLPAEKPAPAPEPGSVESKPNKAAGLPKSTLAMLGLPETATETEVNARLMALSAVGTFGNAALVEKLKTQEEDELIRQALTAGKITPAMEAWARGQIKADPEAFKLYLKTAPVLVPVDHKVVTDPSAKTVKIDETQRSINKQLGISDEDFIKFGGADAAKEAQV